MTLDLFACVTSSLLLPKTRRSFSKGSDGPAVFHFRLPTRCKHPFETSERKLKIIPSCPGPTVLPFQCSASGVIKFASYFGIHVSKHIPRFSSSICFCLPFPHRSPSTARPASSQSHHFPKQQKFKPYTLTPTVLLHPDHCLPNPARSLHLFRNQQKNKILISTNANHTLISIPPLYPGVFFLHQHVRCCCCCNKGSASVTASLERGMFHGSETINVSVSVGTSASAFSFSETFQSNRFQQSDLLGNAAQGRVSWARTVPTR